ncbi:MAG: hypothetical protein K8F32_10135 [Rhodocyclaceae bacterium]|nr:hypothetical protein [Rhodocyclaceae bacterium]
MRRVWWMAVLACFSWVASAAEVGMVTSVAGSVKLLEENKAERALMPFVKLRPGDRLTMEGASRLQLVYFDGGRQETWQGAGRLEVGAKASEAVQGGLQPEVKILPPILVKQLSKTPSADGNVKAGMIRMRSMPSGGTLDSVERHYAELRKQAGASDRNPELYLLAGYFELREYDKLDALLRDMAGKSPDDLEVRTLTALYKRAVANARMAERK